MSRKSITVGLLWHSANSDNLGVGALTVSQIAIAEAAAKALDVDLSFIVIGWLDPRPPYITSPNVEIVGLRQRDVAKPGGLYAALRRCDVVLDIGAGDSFADIYGPRRFWNQLVSKRMALIAGKPLLLSPQTIGPFERWWARRLALSTMRRAEAVFARDALSEKFVRNAGYDGPIGLASDVALRLPFERADLGPAPENRVRFGLNVSGLLFSGGYTQSNMFGLSVDYPGLIRAILTEFTARPDCEVHLVGHVISEVFELEDDYRVSERLAQEFPGVVLAPRFASPSEAKSYISGLDFFAGARMHACIAAFSSGVPVVPMAYSRKFEGLFGTLGYGYTADCKSESAEAILGKIRHGFENRPQLTADLQTALAKGQERLGAYEAALRDLFAKAREKAR